MTELRMNIALSDEEKDVLRIWSDPRRVQSSLKTAALIILMLNDGDKTQTEIAARLGTSKMTVTRWKKIFLQYGLDGLAYR